MLRKPGIGGLLPASYRDNKVFEVVDDFEFIKVLVTDEDFEDAFMSSAGTPFSTKHEALEIRVKLKY